MMRKASTVIILILLLTIQYCITVYATASENAFARVHFYDKNGDGYMTPSNSIQKMTDLDETTHFRSPRGIERGDITIDLYERSKINRIYIKEVASVITKFEILVSEDNINWNLVWEGTTIGGYGRTYTIPAKTVRFVKLNILSTDNEYNDATITIREFQAFYDESIIKDDLQNALYLARIKQDFVSKEVVRKHFTDADRAKLDKLIKKGEDILNSNIQSEIDTITCEIDNYLSYLNSKPKATDEDYEMLYQRYLDSMVGNNLEYNDERKASISALEAQVERDWDLLIKNPRKQLFEEYYYLDGTDIQPVADSLKRINNMIVAYLQENNKYYHNEELYSDAIDAVKWVVDVKFSNDVESYGNWYGWMISVPRSLADTMILTRDIMDKDMQEKIMTAILYRTGGENYYQIWSGGNRTYLCNVFLKLAVCMRNDKYFRGITFSLQDQCVWGNSVNEEAFLYDGTFTAHVGHVYNSGYGLDLINNSGTFMNMLYGTIWQVDQCLIDDFKNKITLGFEPILVNGIVSDVMSGRGLGRGIYYGDVIPKALLSVADFSSEPFRTELKALAKETSLKNNTVNNVTNDDTVIERGPVTRFKRYVMGDKVVYSGKNFGFGLGMFSNRINSFERNLGEIKKAWYSNSGALYIMNNDISQHNNDWWIAVNHYRIPGTTVDTIPRETDRFEGVGKSPHSWVSSIDLYEKYGCAGFTNYNFYSTLKSLKSYFVFDDEIVCIGSDIKGGLKNIETIVQNRRLRTDNSNEFYINNVKVTESSLKNVDATTAYLEGNIEGDSLAYYFPGGSKINYLNSLRTASAKEFWDSTDINQIVSDNFSEIWINHGIHPENEKYSYVIMPNKTRDELQDYSENPDIEIIQQDGYAHIVADKTLGVTGYNIWSDVACVTADGIKTSTAVIMMTKDNGYQYEISLTEPTMENQTEITVEFPFDAHSVIECDPSIKVEALRPLKITANVNDLRGKKLSILVSKSVCDYNTEVLSNSVYYNTELGVTLINNRLSAEFEAVVRDEKYYVPVDKLAAAMNCKFNYSESAGAFQLITDSNIFTVTDDGVVTLNDKPYDADVYVEEGILYASVDTMNEVYFVNSYTDAKHIIFNQKISDDMLNKTIEAVDKYLNEVIIQ